ncbi:MAG: hypothetical protein JXQ84_09510 [Rhodospirillaceae bacterium]|nr:hypothetical protein [Rhodospirillaceae bacterium]
MKPFAVYKLSRAEAALRRLDAAVASLEEAVAERASAPRLIGDVPEMSFGDGENLADLRRQYDVLATAARAASDGIDDTVVRLKHLLEG